MELTNQMRAETLAQALPYIKEYSGKIVVVKYGGNAMKNDEMKLSVMSDITLLTLIGVKETAEIVQMVLAGKVNKNLVNDIQNVGGRAVGLCGADGHLIEAVMQDPSLGYVGRITHINPQPINDLLENGYIPVISTVGYDNEGNAYNINADTAASAIAGVLKAECLISMTDTCGILRDKDDPSTLIPVVNVSEIPMLIKSGTIKGGMIPKTECCLEAIRRGVKKVFIIDGRTPHSILVELMTDEGIGTMFA